ncbi:MAG TPA: sulfurtransferase complex subunit TusC [Cellvibrio sp.]|nr:sulfurtransferase complex subunit TusC [Cellvibrio sp.]
MKKILLVSRHAPYGSSMAKDAIDVALAAAIYDQDISILFMDDGIFQLTKEQNASEISQKNINAMLSAFPLYGVEKLYFHLSSAIQRGIKIDELALDNITALHDEEISTLLNSQDQVLSF